MDYRSTRTYHAIQDNCIWEIRVKGTAVSLFLAFCLAILTWALDNQKLVDTGPYGDKLVGLLTFFLTASFLLHVDSAHNQQAQHEKTRLALSIGRHLEDEPELGEGIEKLLDDHAHTRERYPYLAKLLRRQISSLASKAGHLARGELRGIPLAEANRDYTKGIFAQCQKGSTVMAVAAYPDGQYWKTRLGREYYRFCKLAVDNKANFKRIFIFSDKEELESHSGLLARQQEDGFELKWLLREGLPGLELEENFVVFRGLKEISGCVVWIEGTAEQPIFRWNLSLDETTVNDFEEQFDRIDDVANPLPRTSTPA